LLFPQRFLLLRCQLTPFAVTVTLSLCRLLPALAAASRLLLPLRLLLLELPLQLLLAFRL
jgi:hypothetical protein